MIQYFAQINDQNIVIDLRVVTTEFMAQNPERYPGKWIETFFNTPGHTYAGIGFIWNEKTSDFEAPLELEN
jgi:hypothetical protein